MRRFPNGWRICPACGDLHNASLTAHHAVCEAVHRRAITNSVPMRLAIKAEIDRAIG